MQVAKEPALLRKLAGWLASLRADCAMGRAGERFARRILPSSTVTGSLGDMRPRAHLSKLRCRANNLFHDALRSGSTLKPKNEDEPIAAFESNHATQAPHLRHSTGTG